MKKELAVFALVLGFVRAGIGLTAASPDFRFAVSLPIRLK
jgi:hypothetical protein